MVAVARTNWNSKSVIDCPSLSKSQWDDVQGNIQHSSPLGFGSCFSVVSKKFVCSSIVALFLTCTPLYIERAIGAVIVYPIYLRAPSVSGGDILVKCLERMQPCWADDNVSSSVDGIILFLPVIASSYHSGPYRIEGVVCLPVCSRVGFVSKASTAFGFAAFEIISTNSGYCPARTPAYPSNFSFDLPNSDYFQLPKLFSGEVLCPSIPEVWYNDVRHGHVPFRDWLCLRQPVTSRLAFSCANVTQVANNVKEICA